MSSFTLFAEESLQDYLRRCYSSAMGTADKIAEAEIVSKGVDAIALHIADRHSISVPVVSTESGSMKATLDYEHVNGGKHAMAVVTYSLPFTGDKYLFKLQPHAISSRLPNCSIGDRSQDSDLKFKVYTQYFGSPLPEDRQKGVIREAEAIRNMITQTFEGFKPQLDEYHAALKKGLTENLTARLKKYNDDRDAENNMSI